MQSCSAGPWLWTTGGAAAEKQDGIAADAYYAAPGHLPTLYAGSGVVEFSPTTELQQTIEVVSRNMEAGLSAATEY